MARAIVKFGYSAAYEVEPESIGALLKILSNLTPVAYTYRDSKEVWYYDEKRGNIQIEFVPVVLLAAPPELE